MGGVADPPTSFSIDAGGRDASQTWWDEIEKKKRKRKRNKNIPDINNKNSKFFLYPIRNM